MVNAKNCNDGNKSDTKSTEERWREKIKCVWKSVAGCINEQT